MTASLGNLSRGLGEQFFVVFLFSVTNSFEHVLIAKVIDDYRCHDFYCLGFHMREHVHFSSCVAVEDVYLTTKIILPLLVLDIYKVDIPV